jgi:hypothetical protein
MLTMYVMLPSGEGVTQVNLWQYYANEWPRFLRPRPLGAASANQEGLVTTTLQHVGLATVGGLGTAAIAWLIERLAQRRSKPK